MLNKHNGGETRMKYTKPVAELEKFAVVDVVTTSTTPSRPSGGGAIDTEDEEV